MLSINVEKCIKMPLIRRSVVKSFTIPTAATTKPNHAIESPKIIIRMTFITVTKHRKSFHSKR